ncbi:MAG: FadR/GntR family transcriptional regulator [Candidatus Limnocylindria bacterium]|nr:FadR/GntR family transcriptional regulator [Candidatus Limnocylindria bacterium]
MMFTPIRQARASGEIVSQIERAIFSGELKPGDRLQSERELAEQFSVSRITVRDALRVLEARGLVYVKVGATGGAFVSEANLDSVAESLSTMIRLKRMSLSELAEARKVVEVQAVQLAAQRVTGAAFEHLVEVAERGKQMVRDEGAHFDASMEFHVAAAECAANEVLGATVRAYHELIRSSLADMVDAKSVRNAQKAHEDIVEALRAHDAVAAGEAMLEHLEDFEKRVRKHLQSAGAHGTVTKRKIPLTRAAARKNG